MGSSSTARSVDMHRQKWRLAAALRVTGLETEELGNAFGVSGRSVRCWRNELWFPRPGSLATIEQTLNLGQGWVASDKPLDLNKVRAALYAL